MTEPKVDEKPTEETDSERIKELTYIAEFVDELDFVSAKALFGRMMKNGSK